MKPVFSALHINHVKTMETAKERVEVISVTVQEVGI